MTETWSARDVACPKCGAATGERCTFGTSGVVGSHGARVAAALVRFGVPQPEPVVGDDDEPIHESHGNCWCAARSHCTGGTDCDGECELALRTLDRRREPASEYERTCLGIDCPVLTFVAARSNHCPYCGRDAGDER